MTFTSKRLTADFHEVEAYTGNKESKALLIYGKMSYFCDLDLQT